MKKFNVNVNGTVYSVEVEEVGGTVAVAPVAPAAPAAAPAAPVAAAAPAAAPASAAAPAAAPAPAPKKEAAAAPAGSITVEAPMPGKVLSVNVKAGDKVEAGDVLLILEAMKMQNEIMAPEDGTVSDVRVSAGDTVTGDGCCSLTHATYIKGGRLDYGCFSGSSEICPDGQWFHGFYSGQCHYDPGWVHPALPWPSSRALNRCCLPRLLSGAFYEYPQNRV